MNLIVKTHSGYLGKMLQDCFQAQLVSVRQREGLFCFVKLFGNRMEKIPWIRSYDENELIFHKGPFYNKFGWDPKQENRIVLR